MPARKTYAYPDGTLCLTIPVDFYPTATDIAEAVMWSVDREQPWPKTQRAALEAYRERVRAYGLQDFGIEDLFLDGVYGSAREDAYNEMYERAQALIARLFPTLKEN